MTWDWARKTCIEKNATLVTISSASKNNLVGRLIKTNIWIGLNDRVEAGTSSSVQVLMRVIKLIARLVLQQKGKIYWPIFQLAELVFFRASFCHARFYFQQFVLWKKLFFRNCPTRLSKNNGPSLKLNSFGTKPQMWGEWGFWWKEAHYIRNLLSMHGCSSPTQMRHCYMYVM